MKWAIITRNMAKNLFLQACEVLHIPHTKFFTNRTFNGHPYKYTLFGLSRMLEEYGVETSGVRFSDKKAALDDLQTPFVAQVSGDLVVVKSITDMDVTYQWYDETVNVPHEQFLHQWSGVALLMALTDHAGEPHFKEHHRAEQLEHSKFWLATGCVAAILCIVAVHRAAHFMLPTFHLPLFIIGLSLFIFNLTGLYLSYLLLLRQLKVSSDVADRLCNLLKHSTCTDLLDTPASKVAFGISWSEMGAAYFGINATALLLLPESFPVLGLFSFAALGYTIWSFWYQHFRAHTWCALCLLVQAVFILQAITFLTYLLIARENHSSLFLLNLSFVTIPLSYLAATLIIHLLLSVISKARQADEWRSNFRNFKLKREVFDSLLHQENHYEVEATSHIRFGNPDAPYLLTILTNPYCNPCAAMHTRMSGIQQTDCCVEMVFSSFGKEYDRVCHLMIAAYQQLGAERALKLYEEWYAGGKTKQEAFFDGLGLDTEADAVLAEYAQHKAWRDQTGFSATPTLLVNGYRMPATYQMEDFVDLMKYETA